MTDSARSTSTAVLERHALVKALREAGPEADTLCEGWRAHDLAVHVAARDARPDAIIGQQVPLVADQAKKTYQGFEEMSFEELLNRIESGAPRWSPAQLRAVDEAMNTVEFFVHTEDVLRAAPAGGVQTPRTVPAAVEEKLWRQASRTLFLGIARKKRQRLTFLSPGFGSVTHGGARDPQQVIEGAPGELVLWAFGREEAADVELRRI